MRLNGLADAVRHARRTAEDRALEFLTDDELDQVIAAVSRGDDAGVEFAERVEARGRRRAEIGGWLPARERRRLRRVEKVRRRAIAATRQRSEPTPRVEVEPVESAPVEPPPANVVPLFPVSADRPLTGREWLSERSRRGDGLVSRDIDEQF